MSAPRRIGACLVTFAIVVLAVAPPAPTRTAARTAGQPRAERPRCHPRPGEHAIALSPRAIVYRSASQVKLTGCLRRSGRRRVLYRGIADVESDVPGRLRLAGTHVIFASYADGVRDSAEDIVVSDVAHPDGQTVASAFLRSYNELSPVQNPFPEFTIRADGTAAIVQTELPPYGSVHLITPSGDDRLVDEGADLGRLRFTGRELRWRHGAERRSLRPTLHDVCLGTMGAGSDAVGLYESRPEVSACWRATGRLTHVQRAPADVGDYLPAAVAGPYVAVPIDGERIALIDSRSGAVDTILTPGFIDMRIDDPGSIAWSSARVGGYEVWVRDATGTRLATTLDDVPSIVRDGTVVSWFVRGAAAGSTRLSP